MSKARLVVTGGGVLLVALAVWGAVSSARRAATYEVEARQALAGKEAAEQVSDSLVTESRYFRQVADSLARAAKTAKVRTIEKIVKLPAPPLDTDCDYEKFTAPRDSVIKEQAHAINLWEVAYDNLGAANTNLSEANDILRASNDSLGAVLQRRPRPGFSIVPDIALFAGGAITPAGLQPAIGIGVSWKL